MDRVDAFGDDALGDLDAVGAVEAMRAGSVSATELVDAAIARAEAVNPALNGLAFEAFDRARARARQATPYGGYFDGVPSFIKDNVAVAGMPTREGADAWEAHPAAADGDFARAYLATGLVPLGKTQLSEFGFSASAEHPRLGPVRNPWNVEHTAGASSSGSGAFVAAGRGADRPRQRRRRLDPDSRGLQRPRRSEALARASASGQERAPDAAAHRAQRRPHPVGARHRGLLPRDGTHRRATRSCRRSATSPDRTGTVCTSRCAPGRSRGTRHRRSPS